jgi:hypothetical protein
MTGITIQYFLGIYFLVDAISWGGDQVSANVIRLLAGIILIFLAVSGRSLIG